LREVSENLWVSDAKSASVLAESADLVVDCRTSRRGDTPENVVKMAPSGKTNHSWLASDLDAIVQAVVPRLKDGQTVLIHCRRGRSRSVTAAAAVLVAAGRAKGYEDGVKMAKHPDFCPKSTCLGGLRDWLQSRGQLRGREPVA